jgi:PAS domain S-box-containing protein/putative nucleotidyltransferase with HDIG domain
MSGSAILLVEDDPNSILLTERAFRKAGVKIHLQVVKDGEEAVSYLSGEGIYSDREQHPQPALLLLDLKLPRKSGHEVLAWLRDQPEYKNTPVVILTTSHEPSDIKKAYDLGANTYLVKPVTSESVAELINTLSLPIEQPPHILLIDDDEDIRLLAQHALSREFEGCTIEQIDNQAAFDLALEKGTYDVVITDYHLPWINGLIILKTVKARWPNCPVIMFTGTGSEEIAVEAMKAGLDDYVLKSPRHFNRLSGAVRLLIAQTQHRQAMKEAEARYYSLFESTPIGLFRATLRGQIVDANPPLRHLLGYGEQPFSTAYVLTELFVSEEDAAYWHNTLEHDGRVDNFETRLFGRDREIYWVEINTRLVRDQQGKPIYYHGSMQDITERRKADVVVHESEERYRAFVSNSSEGIWRLEVDLPFPTALPVEEQINRIFHHTRLAECNDVMAQLHGFENAADMNGMYTDQILSPDDSKNIEFMRAFVQSGYRLLDVETHDIDHNGNSRYFLNSMSGFVENDAVVRIWGVQRDLTERKLREREMESIANISTELRLAPSLQEMIPAVLNQVLRLENVSATAIVLREPSTGEIVLEEARGALEGALLPRNTLDPGINGKVITSDEVYINNNFLEDPEYPLLHITENIPALACIPLLSDDERIGALWVGQKSGLSPNKVRLLTHIADIVANAIRRTLLHEQTERHLQRLAALHEIDAAISSSLDLQITLKVLLEQVVTQLHIDAANVLLLSPITPMLQYAAGRGFHTRAIEKTMLRIGEGPAGRAALERTLVHVPDLPDSMKNTQMMDSLGVEGFISYYAVPLIAKGQVKGVLEVFHRTLFNGDEEWVEFLNTLAGQAAIAIENAGLVNDLQRVNTNLAMAWEETIEGWSRALDLRDKETEDHTQRVVTMTERLARVVGVSEQDLVHIRRGALLHDIGKMGVPDAILQKPGPLTPDEWIIMRKHPVIAYELIYPIKYLRPALDIPYGHHEKWDGTGYPRGLKGEQIPLPARLFAIVDVWDALRSDRAYRKKWPEAQVREYIQEFSGTHFDPKLVNVFLKATEDD